MAITFTWSIPTDGLVTKTENGNADTVVIVRYKITADDGTNTAELVQSMPLPLNTETAFIPFETLSEDQVLAWVKASLRPGQEAILQSMVTRILNAKADPVYHPVVKTAPWFTCTQG